MRRAGFAPGLGWRCIGRSGLQ